MLRSMYSGISGMKVNQTKLDVIANNIANVSTTGFKSSQARFKDMLYQNSSNASSPTQTLGGINAKQVGLGAQLSSINKMMGQGNLLTTGRSSDAAIDGEGYFVVAKGTTDIAIDTGATTGNSTTAPDEVYYTRDGNFVIDEQGNLVTTSGYRVMGYYPDDTTIEWTTDANNNSSGTSSPKATVTDAKNSDDVQYTSTELKPLVIPETVNGNRIQSYDISSNGIITAITSEGRMSIGQIGMAAFSNPEGLTTVGGNYSLVSSNSGSAVYRSPANATDSNEGGFGSMVQGVLEASNVDLTEQFTDMITATKAFQAASKMITNGNEILQTITNLV